MRSATAHKVDENDSRFIVTSAFNSSFISCLAGKMKVITNWLLFVAENMSKITSGIVSCTLIDYTKSEVAEMVNAISTKKQYL